MNKLLLHRLRTKFLAIAAVMIAIDTADAQSSQDAAHPPSSQTYQQVGTEPLYIVTRLEILRFPEEDKGGVLLVDGLSTPATTSSASLVLISNGVAPDGFVDLGLVAPPSGVSQGDLTPTEVHFLFDEKLSSAKGFRVRSGNNVLEIQKGVVTTSIPLPPADIQAKILGKQIERVNEGIVVSKAFAKKIPGAIIVQPETPLSTGDSNNAKLTIFVNSNGAVEYSRWN